MPSTIQMPTIVAICFMVLAVYREVKVLWRAFDNYCERKFPRKINGVTIDFKIERKKVAELN